MLRSAASSARSGTTAKKGHINYDVCDVPVKARAAPTMGSGCYSWVMAQCAMWCENNLYFLGGSARSQKRDADAIVGAGHVRRGLTKRGGVLLGQTTAIFLVKEYKGVTMMEIHQCGMGKMRVRVNF